MSSQHNSNSLHNQNNNIIAEAEIFDNDKIDENDLNRIEVKSL